MGEMGERKREKSLESQDEIGEVGNFRSLLLLLLAHLAVCFVWQLLIAQRKAVLASNSNQQPTNSLSSASKLEFGNNQLAQALAITITITITMARSTCEKGTSRLQHDHHDR